MATTGSCPAGISGKRNLTKNLCDRGREEGWDVYDPTYADFDWPQFSSTFADFLAQWKAVVAEVIDKYQPDLLWFDGGSFARTPTNRTRWRCWPYYLNRSREWGKQVCVLNKLPVSLVYNFDPDFGVWNFEAGRDFRPALPERPWNDDMRIGDKLLGLGRRSDLRIGQGTAPRASSTGSVGAAASPLSLSPKADGTIPEAQQQSILEIGEWLAVNGEAIYGTRLGSCRPKATRKN